MRIGRLKLSGSGTVVRGWGMGDSENGLVWHRVHGLGSVEPGSFR